MFKLENNILFKKQNQKLNNKSIKVILFTADVIFIKCFSWCFAHILHFVKHTIRQQREANKTNTFVKLQRFLEDTIISQTNI